MSAAHSREWCPGSRWATRPRGLALCADCGREVRLVGRDHTGWGRTRLANHKAPGAAPAPEPQP